MRPYPGFTNFHGVVMNSLEANSWRRIERSIRRYIDRGHENAASYWLHKCGLMTLDWEELEGLAAYLRRDAARRWFRTWGKWPGNFGVTPEPSGSA